VQIAENVSVTVMPLSSALTKSNAPLHNFVKNFESGCSKTNTRAKFTASSILPARLVTDCEVYLSSDIDPGIANFDHDSLHDATSAHTKIHQPD